MAKNKKPQKQKLNWKTTLVLLCSLFFILVVIAQICFNRYMWTVTQEQAAFKMGILIKSAADNLDELRTRVGDDRRIPEIRLQLPPENHDIEGLKYLYHDDSALVEITSRTLTLALPTKLLTQKNIHDLFNEVPEVQACSRGFTLQFDEKTKDAENLKLSGTKNLSDERTLYIYRETACNIDYGMDELEAYLMQAQSY